MIGIPSSSNSHGARRLSARYALALLAAVVFLFTSAAHAESGVVVGNTPRETDKLKEIQAIIERQGMEIPDRFPSHATVEDIRRIQRDCGRFLDDLKAGKDIEVIEPILRTDDPNHPGLARYQNACRNIKSSEANYSDLSSIGTGGFRLYRLELDGNAKNGLEEVLYAEGNPRVFGNGTYHRVNLQECTARYVTVCCRTAQSPSFPKIVRNVNAIIRYRGKLHVLEMVGEMWKEHGDVVNRISLLGPIPSSGPVCELTTP